MNIPSRIERLRGQPYRIIFGAMLVVLLAEAMMPKLIGTLQVGDLVIAALIFASLLVTLRKRRDAVVAVVLGLSAIAARLVAAVRPDSPVQNSTVLFLSAAFFGYLIWNILRDVSGGDRPTGERIFGALCAYIFIGVLFALLYAHLEYQDPEHHAFTVSNPAIIEAAGSEASLVPLFSYFSFVTLTTLGYGDITPVSDAARTLAWMEALIGQLYLAVMVAGFVAAHISKRAAAIRDDDGSGRA